MPILQKIKSIAKSSSIVYRLVVDVRRAFRSQPEKMLKRLLTEAATGVERPTFVKVGANDGITRDLFGDLFISNQQWIGLLIEPAPYCIAKLQEIYSKRTRFTIEQTAVGNSSCTAKFFYV